MGERIYVASKTIHAHRWIALRDVGMPIISTWIDEAGPGQTIDWPGLFTRCVTEASGADVLICYSEPGEILKGALVEVGAALAHRVSVLWVGPAQNVCRHPLVTVLSSLDEAVFEAIRMAGRTHA